MEYWLIGILQLLGVGFHMMQKVSGLGNSFPQKTRKEILGIFLQEDWDTLCISGLILITCETGHYIIHHYAQTVAAMQYFELTWFGLALVLGYSGQNLVYKWLGSAESYLDKKITDRLQ